ncbi:response regulator transcription factor [Prosthecobacter sp.]|uniref:response regulator transcription factor n=1 Tax=Prosthecobacter sp. TaxID=1965333 RepID=UPI002ABB380C|nr:response regulator transcription factor [Prosthecobacter sp.]MDZ4405110.1 response regulator transcription factor [Prosthecobacter sp.]
MQELTRKQILLVQPLPVVRAGLKFMIDLGSEMKVCAEATTLARARILLPRLQPEVVMVDVEMEDGEGFAFLKEVSSTCARAVIFSRSLSMTAIQRALQSGARAVISHLDSQASVLTALIAVAEGRKHISPCVTEAMTGSLTQTGDHDMQDPERVLSERELQIYHLLGRGHSVKEMAARLGISVKTVESNEARMKEKLGLKNNATLRHEATLFVSRKDGHVEFPNTAIAA